jgi:hypothetical protein
MKWITQGTLALILVFLTREQLFGQAFVEYGKGLGGVKAPTGGISKGRSQGVHRGGATGQEGSAPAPVVTFPAALSIKDEDTYLYAQQDEYSARVEKAQKGATLTPVGQASTNGEKWYMVRSQQGTIGWVKAVAVNEIPKAEEKKNAEEAQQAKQGP